MDDACELKHTDVYASGTANTCTSSKETIKWRPIDDAHSLNKSKSDKGWAWVVLIGCVVNRFLNDGLLSSLGVFLVVWQEQFPGSVTQLAWITSLIVGLTHITAPLGSALCKTFSIRRVAMAGSILSSLSFIAASFSTSLWHLYITFALAGIGIGLSFQPCMVIITYYFDKGLARANGVASAGVAVGIFAVPPLLQVLIDNYGWQGALLIVAGILGHMGICAALYRPTALEIKNRTNSKTHEQSVVSRLDIHRNELNGNPAKRLGCKHLVLNFLTGFDVMLMTNLYFILLIISYFLHGLAYVIAIHYLSVRAVHTGVSDLKAAYLVSAIGIGSFVTRITHGYVIDYQIMPASVLTGIAYVVCAISCALNPVPNKYAGLLILSVLVGLSSGVFNSTIPLIAKEYVGLQQVSGGLGWILLVVGIASILGSYLTGVLVDVTGSYSLPFFLAGTCFLLCSILIFAFPLIKYLNQRNISFRRVQIKEQQNEQGKGSNNAVELRGKV